MTNRTIGKDITRGTICRDRFRAEVTVVCSDQVAQGRASHLLVDIKSRPAKGTAEVVLAFRPLTSSQHGDIRFDRHDGPTTKTFNGNIQELLVIHGRSMSAGNTADVVLDVKIDGEVRESVPFTVVAAPVTPTVEIRAENGVAPAPDLILLGGNARFRAVVSPATAGTFRWFIFRSTALEIRGSAENELVEVVGRRPPSPLPANARLGLCVLFTPTNGPAVFATHLIWPAFDPEQRGLFPVGRTTYTRPSFTIPAGLEGWPDPIEVSMEALVRYPAQRDGVNEPFSTLRTEYPLVILAHGRHSPVEFERNPDGTRRHDAACNFIRLRTGAGTFDEFRSYEGLEYLASHLASHGFIAVSINLNGRFDPTTGVGQLVTPRFREVTCKPYVIDEVAIFHRAQTVLRHIQTMRDMNTTDPRFQGRVDLRNIALIGHSRGGEAVVSAYDIWRRDPALVDPAVDPAARARIQAVVSIAPTDFRNIRIDAPYLAIVGSDDGDVSQVHGLRIYDRAAPPKQMVWIVGAIHNYFSSNWFWQDEVPADPPVTRAQHQDIAGGYCNLFLQAHLRGVAGANPYFTGERRLSSLSGVEIHHAYQVPGTQVVDNFEDAPADRTRNSLGGAVTATGSTFDERALDQLTAACSVNLPSWFQDTNGLMLEWHTLSARYTTSLLRFFPLLDGLSVAGYTVLSFRVGQDSSVNPAGGTQDFRVRLRGRDLRGGPHAEAVLRVSDFGTIPPPRTKAAPAGTSPAPACTSLWGTMTLSFLKTIRLPLARFSQANPNLDLTSLDSISFEFNVNAVGKLTFDDIEFSA
ncbi:MAG: hypothetical protein M3118_07675 [Actinomycetota bacterium]|nr:hypothetical protein [Actinomycetota bacterium]